MNTSNTFLDAEDQDALSQVPTIPGYDRFEDDVVRILVGDLRITDALRAPQIEAVIRAAFRGGLYVHANVEPEREVTP